MYLKSKKGFTLIETYLALFISAVLITLLSVIFSISLRAYRQGRDLLEITKKGQLVLGQITREISGAVVQEEEGIEYIPFIGNETSVYFMAPVQNATPVDLCEAGYVLNGSQIDRHFVTSASRGASGTYEYPGQVDLTNNNLSVFCKNIAAFNLRYHDGTDWMDIPPGRTMTLPRMVEVQVTIQGHYGNPVQTKTFTTWIYLQNS